MAYKPPKQTSSPFGVKPSGTNSSKRSSNKNNKQNPYIDQGGSNKQNSNEWVSVNSSTYNNNNSKPTYSYSTSKPPKHYKINPKNKKLASKTNNEPNAFWHSNPKQDPSATVCAICTKKCQNASIHVDGYKLHRECFKCSKCKKTLNHQSPSSYNKLNDITLHFRDKYICSNCKVQNVYGVYGKCTVCNKGLPSVYFEDSDGNKYHNECFSCIKCGKSLANFNERYFSNVGKDRYCKGCRQKQVYPNKTK